ncbi:MAG: bifunctional nuclease family protein [Planctomycetota bacterium]|jgi:uncharacterized protein|nr:MAG: bifunctional nuclease family protein [Planctomycetota bacterium]RLS96087.1 MAG: bifunctional nuclease family protein [Planctomycetota bacterium]
MNVEMELSRVLILDSSAEQFITLEEKGGSRSFAIKIGTAEALAIERRLRGELPMRPQTHELVDNMMRGLGGELVSIIIHRLVEGTYFASVVVRRTDAAGSELFEIDARPSDAIALGVAHRVPIQVAEEVLLEAALERLEVEPPIEAGEDGDE